MYEWNISIGPWANGDLCTALRHKTTLSYEDGVFKIFEKLISFAFNTDEFVELFRVTQKSSKKRNYED